MAGRFDASIKHLVDAHPADWMKYARLPVTGKLQVVDADISTVSPAADKVIRVGGPDPYIAHLEFQGGPDSRFDRRALLYNALLGWRHDLPVRSVVFLLRPEAQSSVSGCFREELSKRRGTRKEKLDVWTATTLLLGLRYSAEVAKQLLDGVNSMALDMTLSSTYQMILKRGIAKGREKGIEKGKLEGTRELVLEQGNERFGPPPVKVKTAIKAIKDLARMQALGKRVVTASSWKDLLNDAK